MNIEKNDRSMLISESGLPVDREGIQKVYREAVESGDKDKEWEAASILSIFEHDCVLGKYRLSVSDILNLTKSDAEAIWGLQDHLYDTLDLANLSNHAKKIVIKMMGLEIENE